MKKFIVIFACLSVMFSQVGCPSKSAKNEDEESVASEEAPESDSAAAEEGSTEDVASTEEQPEETATSEQMSENQVSNETSPNSGDAFSTPPPEAAPADHQASTPPIPEPSPAAIEPPPAIVESPTPMADASSMPSEPMPVEEKPKALPLLKVDSVPRKENGINLNTVYVTRSGESLKTISQKIYSADKVSEFKANNPGLKNKPSVGTKIYYQSPNRPDDETKVLTYYEDVGMTPEVYVAQSGDDLKKVAKKILGGKEAWKELWVTNSFESKGKLDEGTEIRYWKTPDELAKTQNTSPDLGATGALPEPSATNDQANQLPPPPDMAKNDFPPPPPVDNSLPPPPPPPSDAMAPPPPPPPMDQAKKSKHDETTEDQAVAMDEDTMMALGAVGISAAALAALIVIRRKRKMKDAESEFHSNVG